MFVFRHFLKNLSEPATGPDLSVAQWRALSRQVPLMYAMLVCNTLTVSWTHYDIAPPLYTIYVPGFLILFCVVRTIVWWLNRHKQVCPGSARRSVQIMIGMSVILATGFVAWGLSLFQYGSIEQQFQLASFLAITVIGCVLCLMHVRAAAILVAVIVMMPYVTFLASTGHIGFNAIAINLVAVLATLAFVLVGNHRDFSSLVASRNAMAQRQLETQRLLEENHRLANLDALTGIPNRRHFDRQLRASLKSALEAGTSIAIVRVDIDSFKTVNQIFGQLTGDQVLVEISRRLTAMKADTTFLARLDGDKFVLIMQDPAGNEELQRQGEAINGALSETLHMSLGAVRITASVGIAVSQEGDTPEKLFDRADYVTWVAKREARGGCIVFSKHHARELLQVRRMEEQLHTADLEKEIQVVVQPQYDIVLGRTIGVEVLARWHNAVLGDVSPAEFIPMAERIGKISHITQIVLKQALQLSEVLPGSLRLSVNLSANDIGSTTAIDQIVALVRAHSSPTRVDFEITETAVMRDMGQASQSLLALLRLGSRIALDDFGTGHSSLTHVQRLPLHQIKIDRSFVMDINSDPASRAIVKTMVELCRNLGMNCVFEGVETETQLEALASLGARVMQGYFFGRPMSAAAFLDHLARENAARLFENRVNA